MNILGNEGFSADLTAWSGSAFYVEHACTVPANTDLVLVRIAGDDRTLNLVQLNGANLTLEVSRFDNNNATVKIYSLTSPSTGSQTLRLEAGATTNIETYVTYIQGGSVVSSVSAFAGSSAIATVDATTLSGDYVFDVCSYIDTSTATVGAGQTQTQANTAIKTGYEWAHSYEVATGATTTMSWSLSPSTRYATAAIVVRDTAPSNTTINVDIPLHINLKWDTTHQLAVTHDGGTTTLDGVTLSTPTGWETVTYSGSLPAGDSFASLAATDATLGGGGYTMQAGDILAWETQTGLTVDVNTTPVENPAATVSGSYKIWNEVGQTWTSVSTFTINDLGLNVGSTIPVEDRVTFQAMVGYLITQGYQGAGNETIQKWLIAEGISKKSFNEMLRDYLTGLGYNGTLPEQLRDWRNG